MAENSCWSQKTFACRHLILSKHMLIGAHEALFVVLYPGRLVEPTTQCHSQRQDWQFAVRWGNAAFEPETAGTQPDVLTSEPSALPGPSRRYPPSTGPSPTGWGRRPWAPASRRTRWSRSPPPSAAQSPPPGPKIGFYSIFRICLYT